MACVNDEIDHPFILPHLFFDTAWTAILMNRAFFGDYDTCADSWNSADGRQHLRRHPFHQGRSAATLSKMVLVGLHGDLHTHQDSLYAVCLNRLLGLGHSDEMERFIFTVIWKAEQTRATWDTHLEDVFVELGCHVGWKSLSLHGAVWLETKEVQVLAQGWTEVLAVSQNNANDNMCCLCMVSTGIRDLLFVHRSHQLCNSQTLESRTHELREQGKPVPVLMERSGLRWEFVMIDALHCVDQDVMSRVAATALLGHEG